jgi:hypothetical protein
MKVAYKEPYTKTKKLCYQLTFITALIATWLIVSIIFLLQNRKEINKLKSSGNTMNWIMDNSCYTQFQNNLDKTLFLQLRFKK